MKIGELVYPVSASTRGTVYFSRAVQSCDRSYCKIPDFTLLKLGIIPDFVL